MLIPLDVFYQDGTPLTEGERAARNYDHPDALDWALAGEYLGHLASGLAVALPEYDYETHCRTRPGCLLQTPAPDVVAVEGLFVLHHARLRRLLNASIYVDAPPDVCLARRLKRDAEARGRAPEDIRRRFEEHVMPMAKQHLIPLRRHATYVIDGTAPPAEMLARLLPELRKRLAAPLASERRP